VGALARKVAPRRAKARKSMAGALVQRARWVAWFVHIELDGVGRGRREDLI